MKRLLGGVIILSCLWMTTSCHKDVSAGYYEGIYYQGSTACPGVIEITAAPDNGMKKGTYFTVNDDDMKFTNGTAVKFLVKSYEKDNVVRPANCNWGTYAVVLQEIHAK